MASTLEIPSIETVRGMVKTYSNWGRWGEDDQIGTMNLITPAKVAQGAGLAKRGRVFSLAIPFDDAGPQTGGLARFNPIHLMIRDGNDALANTTARDFYGGRQAHFAGTDDLVIMPLQCGTQWDGLSHVVFEDHIYNGFHASWVSSRGALRADIAQIADRVIGRGVLLDVARARGVDCLEPGTAITDADLEACVRRQRTQVGEGDIVLVRTGQMGMVRREGRWGQYAGGAAPGLGLASVPWIFERGIAALATDTWGAEVLPNETPDVFQPLHVVLIVAMGLTVGEIFDLEALADDCASDGVYEFLFCAPPLPFTRAVGSPTNPIAVK